MNMKKTFGICATLLAALLCAVPWSAQATGKIRSVDVYDPDGRYTFPNADNAMTVGDTVYVRFRLVNPCWAETQTAADGGNPSLTYPWEFWYTGGSLADLTPEQIAALATPPRLGLWISGTLREAECVNFPLGEASTWLSDVMPSGAKHYTDLIFKYTVQKGDLALPIQLANASGTGPATGDEPYYFKYKKLPTKWRLECSTGGVQRVVADFAFGPSNLDDDPDFHGTNLSTWEMYAQPQENRDMTLLKAGAYIRALDLDDYYDDKDADPWIWRTIAQGSTTAEPGSPAIAITGGAATNMNLYIWTDNTNVAEIVKGGQVEKVDPYVFYDGVTRLVGRIHIPATRESASFSVKATGAVGETTQVYLSDTPTNILNASEVPINNFITRTIKVGKALPPSISVKLGSEKTDNLTITANADDAQAQLSVNLELTAPYGSDLEIPVKVTMLKDASLNVRDYAGLSWSETGDNLAWDSTIRIPAGSLTASASDSTGKGVLYMYANRGNADTQLGLLVEVDTNELNRVNPAVMATYTGKFKSAIVYIKPSTPSIMTDLSSTYPAEAGTSKSFTIEVSDAWGERDGPYTIRWAYDHPTTTTNEYTVISDGVAVDRIANGASVTFSVPIPINKPSGTYTNWFHVLNRDGSQSTPDTIVVWNVTAPLSTGMTCKKLKEKFAEDGYNDQDVVRIDFKNGFSMPSKYDRPEGDGYLFLIPLSANASNLAFCAEANLDAYGRCDWKHGIQILSGDDSLTIPMMLLDGSLNRYKQGTRLKYQAVIRTEPSLDDGQLVTEWGTAHTFELEVTNVTPRVKYVKMGNHSSNKVSNGGHMGSHVTVNATKIFTVGLSDSEGEGEPSEVDLYADGEQEHVDPEDYYKDASKAFTTRWTYAWENNDPEGEPEILYGPPGSVSHSFPRSGKWTVTVQLRDKDMYARDGDTWEDVYAFSFTVDVDENPSVSLSPANGLNTFYEGSLNQSAKINVSLSTPPSAPITVHIDVRRATEAQGTENYPLPILNSYDVDLSNTKTNTPVWFTTLDGTDLGTEKGYVLTAYVTNGTVNADGVAWSNLYERAELEVFVVNEKPTIDPAGSPTNSVARNQAFSIPFKFSDVCPLDFAGTNMTVTWTTSEGFYTNYMVTSTRLGTYQGNSPQFIFTSASTESKLKTVVLLVEDKDGGWDQRTWYYIVNPSKSLLIYPRSPDTARTSTFTTSYTGAPGLGAGRVWSEAQYVIGFETFTHEYTFPPERPTVNAYARGYKVGDVDDGTLTPGVDIAIDENGTHFLAGTYSSHYSYEDAYRDSFFYAWILNTAGEGGGVFTGQLLSFDPAVEAKIGSKHISQQLVTLPEFDAESPSYDPVVIDAIFSKELYPADNVGDINLDGIPDVYAVERLFGGGKLYQFATGATEDGGGEGETATASDLKPLLTAFNGDGDYLPAGSVTSGSIPATADGWSTVGRPFTARQEIRGFHDALNYRMDKTPPDPASRNYNVTGKWVSDPSFSEAETNAVAYWNGLQTLADFKKEHAEDDEADYAVALATWRAAFDAKLNENTSWIPENRTDPTVDDTDGDGFPDGYEYYFWYMAAVGWIDADGNWKRLEGEKFQLEDIAKGVPISSDDIVSAFNPTVAAAGGTLAGRDTDNDGLTDLEELALGTNPVHWDTDGDGMSDLWEVMRGLSPLQLPTATDKNPDGDFMASFTNEVTYSVLTFTNSAGKAFAYAVAGDGSPYVDDTGVLAAGVSNINAIAVYRYGGDGSPYTPVSRGAYGKDESISYLNRLGRKYAGGTWGDIRIATAKPLDVAEVDVSDMGLASFETNKIVFLIHDQVYAQFGFDPRTAWNKDINGFVAVRWDASRSPNVNMGDTGRATNTVAYTCLDEYLVLKYRYMAKSGDKPLRSLEEDLDKISKGALTIAGVLAAGTTNPNVPFEQVSYTVTGAPSSGEGESETTAQGAAIPTYTSTNHGADTDEDGIPDGWELYVMYNPNDNKDASGDDDHDGLSLATEFAGTDSCNAYESAVNAAGVATIHAQHPGNVSSWFNKFFPTDPWDIDTDGDGITDGAEGASWTAEFKIAAYANGHTYTFIYGEPADDGKLCIRGGGLNPCSVDTDRDLLPDPWERDFAGVVFTGGSPEGFALPSDTVAIINRNDGITGASGSGSYITAGMDGTFDGDAVTTGSRDPRTGTSRNFDFDNDGLQNFQEYLVQTLRHLRYDDTETPLMGSYLPDGLAGTRKYVGFLPMQTWDGAEFFKAARAAGFTGLSAYGGEGFRYRDLGYFARPPKSWDLLAQNPRGINTCTNYEEPGYRVMLRPAGLSPNAAAGKEDRIPARSYATTDPRLWDSDGDGMDDYYELFHGLNPLLGKVDVISAAYNVAYDGILYSAFYNAWVGWPQMPPMIEPIYDVMKYPWYMGVAEADADGDGLRNTEEALLVNTPSPQNYHTDPTPLWMTDSSAKTSFTAQYYGRDPIVTAAMGIPDLTQYPWFAIVDSNAPDGSVKDFMFSFEENEGFDTDHDWLPDGQELTHVVTSATDPRNGDDPDRRQAMYFPGQDSAVASYSGTFSRPVGENYAMLRKFTVEAWIRPDGMAQEQTILARVSDYPNSTLSNALHQVRANFRIGLDAEGRVFGQFDSSDAVESGSANGFGTVTVRGSVLDAETWSHIALTYNGSALVLYVNGREVNRAGSNLIPANGIVLTKQSVTPEGANFGENGYTTYPGVFLVGADAATLGATVLDKYSSWSNYRAFYKGWVDEVRVWDGDRTANQIAADYEKRYSFDDVKALREEIYTSWLDYATRNENDGKPDLPPELLLHYSFQQLPSEVNTDYVASEPSGFTEKVVDNVKWNEHSVDLRCGWWSAIPIASGVYANRALVPWIRNTCGMLPAMDGFAADSQYWSERLGGVTLPLEVSVTSFMFPNTACPYPYWNYMAEGTFRELLLNNIMGRLSDGNLRTAASDLMKRFKFDERTGFVGGADLLPLGDAFAKRCPDFWDGQGATDASTATVDDLDNDGLPDWWEDYAVAQYGVADAAALTTATMVDYILPSGETVRMSAAQAYQIDLARGMLPGGAYDDAYSSLDVDANEDSIPDWWQRMYGVLGFDPDSDPDNDGLSNYQEWLISWGDAYGFGLVNGFPLLDPMQMCSEGDHGVIDYFAQSTNPDYEGYYLGEIVADHDFIEDWWEDQYDETLISRNRWDAALDLDNDGWSNFAEARAGTDPTATSVLSIGQEELPAYPIPAIEATVSLDTGAAVNGTVVIQAWSDASLQGAPDATWRVSAGAGQAMNYERLVGKNPNSTLTIQLGPGSVVPDTVWIDICTPMSTLNEYNVSSNGNWTLVKTTALGTSPWLRMVKDAADGDSGMGNLIIMNSGSVVGTINYKTGIAVVDCAKFPEEWRQYSGESSLIYVAPADAYLKARWSSKMLSGSSMTQLYLGAPTEGHLREGKNTFVAFLGNGDYASKGDPMAFLRDVDVGWSRVTDLSFELITDPPSGPNVSTSYNDERLVRIVRTAINGKASTDARRVVFARKIDFNGRPYLTRADYVRAGAFDLDWKYLVEDARKLGMNPADIVSADYAIVIGNNDLNDLQTSASDVFTKTFSVDRSAPVVASPAVTSGYFVQAARPTFTWTGGEGYTAFAIEVATVDSPDAVVWSSGTNTLPARSARGYEFTPEIYVGRELLDNTNYFWRVAQFNAKYNSLATLGDRDVVWSDWAAFKTAIDSAKNDTGCGRVKVDVRYYGPAVDEPLTNVYVEVFKTPDFTGKPLASVKLGDRLSADGVTADLALTNLLDFVAAQTNNLVTFDGVPKGTVYVRAFIDRNGNGKRDIWETWGYANQVGSGSAVLYAPMPLTVTGLASTTPACVVFMEDTDINQNGIPDCREDLSDLAAAAASVSAAAEDNTDVDRDGLTGEEEDEFGTDATVWDTDGDGMPDGWEAKFADTDPYTPDADAVAADDVMAYAVTNLAVITTWDGVDSSSATNRYAVMDARAKVKAGDDATPLAMNHNLRLIYDYGGTNGLGRIVETLPDNMYVYAVEPNAEVVLVHAQVYEFFGFDPTTANPTIREPTDTSWEYDSVSGYHYVTNYAYGANTKPFTALDKYLVCRYLENAYGLADETAMNTNGTWSSYTLKPGDSDCNRDGVPDGWELYVMFGTNTVVTLAEAKVSPFAAADYVRDPSYTPDGGELSILDEYDGGRAPTDPWNTDSDEDGISDKDGFKFRLNWGAWQNDDDGDGLSNWTEYLASKQWAAQLGGNLDPEDYMTDGATPDYWRTVTVDGKRRYLGELYTDHDMMGTEWERLFEDLSYVNYTIWDAADDSDGDGWSNLSEARVLTDPSLDATLSLVSLGADEDNRLPAYPMPTVRMKVSYNGTSDAFNDKIVVKAWHGSALSGMPDASWTVVGANNATVTCSRFLGLNPNRVVKFNVGPGMLAEYRCVVSFFAPSHYHVTSGKTTLFGIDADATHWHGAGGDNPQVNPQGHYSGDFGNGRGFVDYRTGDVEIDFTQFQDPDYVIKIGDDEYAHLDQRTSFVRFSWASRVVSKGNTKEFHLSVADEDASTRGYLREGKTTFVAFVDANDNGVCDAGEPYGFVRDVDVGWDEVPEVSILLTDDNSGVRFSVDGKGVQRVSVVRTAINGEGTRARIIWSREADLDIRNWFGAADFMAPDAFDFDWTYLCKDAAKYGIAPDEITSATYAVMVDGAAVETFTRTFDAARTATAAVSPSDTSGSHVYMARPQFVWTGTDNMSAFQLQIARDREFTDIVWDSGLKPLSVAGNRAYSAPVYVGPGEVLEDNTNYFWRVAEMNAKYQTPDGFWSEPAEFHTKVNCRGIPDVTSAEVGALETGYGSLAVEVRYFGPSDASCSNVVIGVYENADFTGYPVARARLSGDIGTVQGLVNDPGVPFSTITTNAAGYVRLDGIAPGSYYVMAFIDLNTNGVRDAYEPWGHLIGREELGDTHHPGTLLVRSEARVPPACMIIMEDTDVNQNDVPDCLEEGLDLWSDATLGEDDDSDGDGLSDTEEDDLGTDATKWDTDEDGMPDGWEVLFAETDPITPDADEVVSGDVMAYAVTNLTVVTLWNGVDQMSATNKYVVTNLTLKVAVGDYADAPSLADVLACTYDYAGKYGFGRAADAADLAGLKVYAVEENAEVVLVHAQVYDAFGFDPTTANSAAISTNDEGVVVYGANTKPFTALDKYLVCRYFENVYGHDFADEVAMNTNRTWASFTLKPGDPDNNKDGVPDGWELYVMFGLDGATATLDEAKISPFSEICGLSAADYVRDSANTPDNGGLTLVEEWGEGIAVTDPWKDDTDEDGISDALEHQYGLVGNMFLEDSDNDGLSNFMEYLIGAVYGIEPLDSFNANSHGQAVPDYFLANADTGNYLGFDYGDHDFMDDWWEDQFNPDKVSRFMFDAWDDPDNDGWSNFAEARAGTDPTRQNEAGVDGYAEIEHPVPTVNITFVQADGTHDAPIMVRAFPDGGDNNMPDAIWTLGSDVASSRYLGSNPGPGVTQTVMFGPCEPGSVKLQIKCPIYYHHTRTWKNGVLTKHSIAFSLVSDWVTPVSDKPRESDKTMGDLLWVGAPIGTINYRTGEATIDYSKFPDSLIVVESSTHQTINKTNATGGDDGADVIDTEESTEYPSNGAWILASWKGVVPAGVWRHSVNLSSPDKTNVGVSRGALREGKTTFVAFLDENENGAWDPGEPYGAVSGVDVGWFGASCEIELTRTTSQIARMDIASVAAAGGFDAANDLTDRRVVGTPTAANVESGLSSAADLTTRLVRMRVLRTLVNGERVETTNVYGVVESPYDAVVLDRYIDIARNPLLTEASVLTAGLVDLDWGTLTNAWVGAGNAVISGLTNATYRIVLGEGSVALADGAGLPLMFVNRFEGGESQSMALPVSPMSGGNVNAASPTFRWTHDNTIGKVYPAFRLRVWKDDGTTLVYDSGVRPAPARTSDGTYEWTAPIYADMVTPQGVVFERGKSYKWSVSMLDAKFTEPNKKETQFAFTLNTADAGAPGTVSDYGAVKVAVRYYGPAETSTDAGALKKLIRVQAFERPDFTGDPVGETYVTNVADIASTDDVTTINATILGLKPGAYYVRAFIDSDGDCAWSRWETWGYANNVGTDERYLYMPRAVTVAVGEMPPETVVFLEDMDTDNDGIPDAKEWDDNGSLGPSRIGITTGDGSDAIPETGGTLVFALKPEPTDPVTLTLTLERTADCGAAWPTLTKADGDALDCVTDEKSCTYTYSGVAEGAVSVCLTNLDGTVGSSYAVTVSADDSDRYLTSMFNFSVTNCAPAIGPVEWINYAETNAVIVMMRDPVQITASVDDVAADLEAGLHVYWRGEGLVSTNAAVVTSNAFTVATNGVTVVTNKVSGTYTFAFTDGTSGLRKATLVAEDKDGGVATRDYWYYVVAPRDDFDNDGLSNWWEWKLEGKLHDNHGFQAVSYTNQVSKVAESPDQDVPDYFLKRGSSYFGFLFADHDFMEDWWEDLFDPDKVSRFVFDAWDDPDDDGWSNFAEARAGTDPTTRISQLLDGGTLDEIPTPTIRLKAVYANRESQQLDAAALVIKAYSADSPQVPDAVWNVSVSGNQESSVDLGANSGDTRTFNLWPGSVVPGSVKVEFRDPNALVHMAEADDIWLDPSDATWIVGLYEEYKTGEHVSCLRRGRDGGVAGTVDYKTGMATLDFSKMQDYLYYDVTSSEPTYTEPPASNDWGRINLAKSFVRVRWTGKVVSEGNVCETRLAAPNVKGRLREGKYLFEVFADKDGSGEWTPGEPYGIVTDVDVGWSEASVEVEMTDVNSSLFRINMRDAIANNTFVAQQQLSDRGVLLSGDGRNVPIAAGQEGTNMPNATSSDVVLRFVRVSVNGIAQRRVDTMVYYTSRLVMELNKNLASNPLVTEKDLDLLPVGKWDLDWNAFTNSTYLSNNLGLESKDSITSVVYKVVIGTGSISATVTNNNLATCFVNRFENGATQSKTTPLEPVGHICAQPTFKWKHANTIGKDYPAFRLKVKSGTTLIYDSGVRKAPPRSQEGVYSWTAPIYPDMMTPKGRVFATTNDYTWSVSMLDAKYTTFNDDEETTSFRLVASGYLDQIDDYGMIRARVRYFGSTPTANNALANLVRVQAFTTPDFSGMPAGEAYVKDLSNLGSESAIDVNATILGLKPGTYYVRAYIDTNGNGSWDKWESWGYGNYVHTSNPALYTPRAYEIAINGPLPEAEIFIEDMDTDRDGLADSKEMATKNSLTELKSATGATFFTRVNPDLATSLSPLNFGDSASSPAYAPITLMSALAAVDDTPVADGDVVVRIDDFSLDGGLDLTVMSDVTEVSTRAKTVMAFSSTADVNVILVAAKKPDFSDATEAIVETLSLSAQGTTEVKVPAEKIKATIDAANLGSAAFFKVKLEQ